MPPSDQTRQTAAFDHVRSSILAGVLPAGGRLPPSRSLARELGVARQTVVLAYERLAAEGYVRGRTGSGTYGRNRFARPGSGRRGTAAWRCHRLVAARGASGGDSGDRPGCV
jgi:DNA-binding transcriptional MocR family regulator